MSKELAAQADQQDQEKIYKQLEVELNVTTGNCTVFNAAEDLQYKILPMKKKASEQRAGSTG